ncbi:arginine--tRNA ligase [Puniceicoccaceae bacterium K14]|nr:arginine--tRNA ligase [Puniceicoccaceae bacterium K14]
MKDWFDVAKKIESRVLLAAESAGLDLAVFDADVRPADPRFGDVQANGALPYAKRHKTNPRQLAQSILAKLEEDDEVKGVATLSIAGPGFINFTLKPTFILEWVKTFSGETALRESAGQLKANRKVVVDFGSPNTAKQMHVGHIRSIVIGETICRLLEFCGAKVVRDNHIGDWGTPYGKLFYAYKRELDQEALENDPLEELERLYKLGSSLANEDESVLEESRQELVALQNGDSQSMALWERVNDLSIQGLKTIYEVLDVTYDCYLGESFYRDKVEQVYNELCESGIAEESKGALVVFHPEHKRYSKQPFIIRKSDGASNYATTDLATMLYRKEHFEATDVIIVTDARQKDHFEQLDLTCQKWFQASKRDLPDFSHVMFGSINGEDGKPIKSRSGDPIRLRELLNESIERAYVIVKEKFEERNAAIDEEELMHIASVVGVSAIKYADLSQNRTSDYQFSWNKLLAFDGNTAPYLLYAATRVQSIFRKLEAGDQNDLESKASPYETAEELALAKKVIGFVGTLHTTVDTLKPHFLCTYLYELAGTFSAFYAANTVIVDDEGQKARRILLCKRTLEILKTGLSLLGIPTLERM